jgi:O-acetylserine/cysteine efflux transporter
MRNRLSGRDLTLILAVTALWGFTFVPIKVALVEVPPFALAAVRFLLAAVPVCFFVRRPAMPARSVIAYGLAIGVVQFGLLFLGMKLGMPAGLSSLTIQVQVFFTMGLAVLFTHDRLQRHHLAGAAIATAGIVVLGAYKIAAGASVTFIGFLLVLGAAVGWALGNIFSLVVWSSLVPPLPLAVLSYAFEGGSAPWLAVLHMSALAWACVLVMSYGATLFAYATWNRLLHRYPTGLISPFALLIPVTGLASGAIFLGESIAAVQALGAVLVLLGLLVNVYGARRPATALSGIRPSSGR